VTDPRGQHIREFTDFLGVSVDARTNWRFVVFLCALAPLIIHTSSIGRLTWNSSSSEIAISRTSMGQINKNININPATRVNPATNVTGR
jgi:type IV secretory pathway TrbF-like protein